jgi:hypothetical protein
VIVVKAIRFDKEEEQAIEKVIDMIYQLEDSELALIDGYLLAQGEPAYLDDIRTGLKTLLQLSKKD